MSVRWETNWELEGLSQLLAKAEPACVPCSDSDIALPPHPKLRIALKTDAVGFGRFRAQLEQGLPSHALLDQVFDNGDADDESRQVSRPVAPV
eukprot:6202-Heterococcus_DN1.PRE.2